MVGKNPTILINPKSYAAPSGVKNVEKSKVTAKGLYDDKPFASLEKVAINDEPNSIMDVNGMMEENVLSVAVENDEMSDDRCKESIQVLVGLSGKDGLVVDPTPIEEGEYVPTDVVVGVAVDGIDDNPGILAEVIDEEASVKDHSSLFKDKNVEDVPYEEEVSNSCSNDFSVFNNSEDDPSRKIGSFNSKNCSTLYSAHLKKDIKKFGPLKSSL